MVYKAQGDRYVFNNEELLREVFKQKLSGDKGCRPYTENNAISFNTFVHVLLSMRHPLKLISIKITKGYINNRFTFTADD